MGEYQDLCMRLYWDCQDLLMKLSEGDMKINRKESIISYLEKMDNKYPQIPEFKPECSWFNVDRPVTVERLKGLVTVLDFFTYCCINCMHILPDLEKLEDKWSGKGVVVVGVHSAKFENEKNGAQLGHALVRYNIRHAVCNDSQASMWSTLGVTCWPTQLILGPGGRPVWVAMGEGHAAWVDELVGVMVEFYRSRGLLTGVPLEIVENSEVEGRVLNYPGKVVANGERVVVSDSGNHRLLVLSKDGKLEFVVGDGKAGYKDGGLHEAKFNNPQGVCVVEDRLYVCDTDSHRLRCVDLPSRNVTTVVGTGVMGTDKVGGKQGIEQDISSPWDICHVEQGEGEGLLVAMAGLHQVWLYCLTDIIWWKGVNYTKGTMVRVVGSGMEENRNNSYPHKAGLAQPSGICCDKEWFYLADSESSTVRKVSRKDGGVKNLCGGERDPTNLFAYGHADGDGVQAKLQHPLGVCVWGELVYIADSYNHMVRVVAGSKGSVSTMLIGDGNSLTLCEPGGLCVDGDSIYIADTNNHCIKVVDLDTKVTKVLDVVMEDTVDKMDENNVFSYKIDDQQGTLTLKLEVQLLNGSKLNVEAPSSWTLAVSQEDWVHDATGELAGGALDIPVHHPAISNGQLVTIELSTRLYICTSDGLCMVKNRKHVVRVTAEKGILGSALDLGVITG